MPCCERDALGISNMLRIRLNECTLLVLAQATPPIRVVPRMARRAFPITQRSPYPLRINRRDTARQRLVGGGAGVRCPCLLATMRCLVASMRAIVPRLGRYEFPLMATIKPLRSSPSVRRGPIAIRVRGALPLVPNRSFRRCGTLW
ncbi:hypothetical protein BAB79_03675 [Mycobacteroides abscessus]|nr:hypothetical protein A3O06_03675 [Mycobacteroides abscessus]ANO22803.1 hypothetical protein BAB79_03675 [Mycobacteroides abscessus]EIC62612.1 hypothetical protein OUW_21904 [Mycobacteroides abscessus M93]